MRNFLIRSALLLLLALLVTVAVFFWLHKTTVLPAITEQVHIIGNGTPTNDEEIKNTDTTPTFEKFNIPAEGIKISTLSLGEQQIKALETAGINVQTFVLTEAMIVCGVGKLGDARAAEIFAGDAPSLIETGKLLTCLRS